ncbi:MAG: DUF2834 domain-containing protein [Caldilineaceae bacterium]|nr:DUF2834 domain-containing protein [Caldilineaceae bacterium]
MKYIYGLLAMLGVVLPFSQFVPWLSENGLSLSLMLAEASSSRIGAFAWLDVIVSAVALIGFMLVEGARLKMARLWLPILGTCAVGVSLGLPLFLLMRELHFEQHSVE